MIVRNLSDELRKPPYKGNSNKLAGHCYVASEALYHLAGGSKHFIPYNVQHEGSSHWYLKNKQTGEVVDITAKQFKTPVPYCHGIGRGFLTKKPSKRTQKVIDAVRRDFEMIKVG